MTKQKNTLKKTRVKKASQKQKLALLNYGILKNTISEYTKQTSLKEIHVLAR